MPQCSPYLFYADTNAAVEFLERAFGFSVDVAHRLESGAIGHAQLRLGDAVVMLGAAGGEDALRPIKTPAQQGSLNASVYLYVDDVDTHCDVARAEGAEVVMEPTDMFWGDRMYCVVDPDGQFWSIATHRPS